MTEYKTSAGAIVFRETRDPRQYLLLKSRTKDWEFPKGSIEGDEELQQTAKREVAEETGLSGFRLIDGFREEYSYEFTHDGTKVEKTVHLFVAQAFKVNAELSHEHHDLQWQPYEDALNTVDHSGPKRILREAERFVQENI